MYQACSGLEACYPWWYWGTGVGSDFLGSRWGHQTPAWTTLKPLWYLLYPSQSWLLSCSKYELQMIFLILSLAITHFCLSELQHFLGMGSAVPTAELAAPTHPLGVWWPWSAGREDGGSPLSCPLCSSLLQLTEPCVAVGRVCCMQEVCWSGGPRDEAAAMQQSTWCLTKIGMLRAFFLWLSVKKEQSKKDQSFLKPKQLPREGKAVWAKGRKAVMAGIIQVWSHQSSNIQVWSHQSSLLS